MAQSDSTEAGVRFSYKAGKRLLGRCGCMAPFQPCMC